MKKTILIMALFLTACHSYEGVKLSNPIDEKINNYYILTPAVSPEDNIRYELKDGSKGEGIVSSIDGKTIHTKEGKSIKIYDIKSLDKRDFSPGKTTAVIGGSAAAVAIIWVSVFALAVGAAVAAA